MSNPFNTFGRDLAEESLKYDDHNPKQRKQMEDWLIRTKPKITKPIQTRTKPFKAIPKVSTPLNIDINLPKQLEFDFKAKSEPMNIDISLPPELTKLLGGN